MALTTPKLAQDHQPLRRGALAALVKQSGQVVGVQKVGSVGWHKADRRSRGGVVTGTMTAFGGVFHSLPFLISSVHTALVVAGVVVATELIAISLIRRRFLAVSLRTSLLQVALGGALIVAAGVGLGSA